MVKEAILLPDSAVETVAQKQESVSVEAVEATFSDTELREYQRTAKAGGVPVTVVARFEKHEWGRVEEAASEVGVDPAVWLAETVKEVHAEEEIPRPETLGEQLERIIFARTEA